MKIYVCNLHLNSISNEKIVKLISHILFFYNVCVVFNDFFHWKVNKACPLIQHSFNWTEHAISFQTLSRLITSLMRPFNLKYTISRTGRLLLHVYAKMHISISFFMSTILFIWKFILPVGNVCDTAEHFFSKTMNCQFEMFTTLTIQINWN